LIVSAGSSGLAEKRWFQKAPKLGAVSVTKRFADIAPEIELSFNSGYGQPDAPRVLRPSKADSKFIDFTVLFDVKSWEFLADATPSAESQILGAILALGALSKKEASSVKQRCRNLGITLVSVAIDTAPAPEPMADFHADARENLQHEIFWDCSNDYGPVGNDTGADVLGLYREWRVDRDAHSRGEFFDSLLSLWHLEVVEELSTADVEERLRDSEFGLLTWDDAIIGWAITQIACDGTVDAKVRHLAEVAISRQSDDKVVQYRGWPSPDKRIATLKIVVDAVRLAPQV
jgi:uncharacterized protein YfeS